MATPYFELITELQTCIRRDFPTALSLSPTATIPVLEGEWLNLNSSYQLERGTEKTTVLVFPVHTERGRYDTQAIGKVNVIFAGMYEAETRVHDGTLSGYVVGDPLVAGDVTIDAQTRRGLVKDATTDGRVVVGYITKVTGTGTAAKLRFIHFGRQRYDAI